MASAQSPLFSSTQRSQYKLFVASQGIDDPSAVKASVAAQGGLTVDNPHDAQLFLCNPKVIPSSLLAFKDDPSKTFLDVAWLNHSIASRHLLLGSPDFGGHLISKSSLLNGMAYPSPRVTPQPLSDFGISLQTAQALSSSSSMSVTNPAFPNGSAQPPPEFYGWVAQVMSNPILLDMYKNQVALGNPQSTPVSASTTAPTAATPTPRTATPTPSTPPSLAGPSSSSTSTSIPAGGKLFQGPKGPLRFQVDIHLGSRRAELIQKIKANGGIIVAQNPDYTIYNTQSADYSEVYHTSAAQMVRRQFVDDCIKQQRLLDPKPYLDTEPEHKQRRVNSSLAFAVKRENRSRSPVPPPVSAPPQLSRKEEKRPASRQPSLTPSTSRHPSTKEDRASICRVTPPIMQEDKPPVPAQSAPPPPASAPPTFSSTGQKRKQPDVPQPSSSSGKPPKQRRKTEEFAKMVPPAKAKTAQPQPPGPRGDTPPPPPDSDRTEYSGGKFRYTPKENEWAIKYVEHLWTRDPNLGKTDLATFLHLKTPHHSVSSWLTSISRLKNLDKIKKKASIQYRKRLSLGIHTEAAAEDPATSSVDTSNDNSQSSAAPAATSRDHESVSVEENVQRVAKFFALRQGDEEGEVNDSDDESTQWNRLARLHPCPTGYQNWRHFYDKEHRAIEAEYNRIIAS